MPLILVKRNNCCLPARAEERVLMTLGTERTNTRFALGGLHVEPHAASMMKDGLGLDVDKLHRRAMGLRGGHC